MKIPYGKSSLEFSIDGAEVVHPHDHLSSGKDEILEALSAPINSEPLFRIAKPGNKVSIIVSDATRASPTQAMLRPLIGELKRGGVALQDITIVFGLGLHRRQTEDEKRAILGEFYSMQHIEHDLADCVPVGTTSRGTPVEVFRRVADSDIVVCTGDIEFHYYAGYTGGAKALLPGVCSKKTIDMNHSLMLDPNSTIGRLDGPVRKDIDEAGSLFGIDFILNAVINSGGEVVGAVAGNPVDAHRAGAKIVDHMYRVSIEEPADVAVVSPGGYPKDIDMYQSHKALENVRLAVKDGGAIILAAECKEGYGNKVFASWLDQCSTPEAAVEKFRSGFEMGGHKAALLAGLAKKFEMYLVSSLPEDIVRRAYLRPARGIQQALDEIRGRKSNARVVIVPNASYTLVDAGK